jgi:hypothetical protein
MFLSEKFHQLLDMVGYSGGGGGVSEAAPVTRPTGVSWATASPEAKRNLPAPPERAQFDSNETFEEAKSGWMHRVMPILAMRQASCSSKPTT